MSEIGSAAAWSDWSHEPSRWRDYYERRLEEALLETIQHVRGQRPERLAAHCDSLLTLLEQVRSHSRLHGSMVELMVALGDWPLRWGQWHAWDRLLRFGLNVADAKRELDRYAQLLYQLAQLSLYTGRLEKAAELGQQAVEAASVARAADPLAQAADLLVTIFARQGKKDAARDLLEQAERSLANCPDVGSAPVYLYWCRALLARRQGHVNESVDWADRAVTLLQKPGADPHLLGEALETRGVYRWARAEYAAAVGDLNQATTLHASIGDEYAAIHSQSNLVLVYLDTGRFVQAEALIRRIITFEEQRGARWEVAMNVGNLGWLYLLQGKFDQALIHSEQHVHWAMQNRDAQETARARAIRGKILIHSAHPETALPDLEMWHTFHRERGSPEGLVDSYGTIARCLARLNRQDEATSMAREALALAHQIGQPALQFALRCLAEQSPAGQRGPLLQDALSMARQMGRKLDEAACLLWLAGAKSGRDRTRLWNQGARLLDEIGAGDWLKTYSLQRPPPIP